MVQIDEFLDIAEKPEKQDGGRIVGFDNHADHVAGAMKVRDFEHYAHPRSGVRGCAGGCGMRGWSTSPMNGCAPFFR